MTTPSNPFPSRPGEPDDHDHDHNGCCGGGCGGHGGEGGHAHHHHDHDQAEDADPMFVFSRKAIREVDRLAVEEFGIPSIVLMENAARGLRNAVLELVEPAEFSLGEVEEEPQQPQESILIVCGSGNNGGDGFALARHLANDGLPTVVVLAADDSAYTGDAATNLKIIRRMNLPIARSIDEGLTLLEALVAEIDAALGADDDLPRHWSGPTVIVDALLGTGASSALREDAAAIIAEINRLGDGDEERGARSIILAADLPSGIDADTGEPLGPEDAPAVKADMTVTFVGLKAGFLCEAAQPYLGEVVVVDIGSPLELTLRLGELLEESHHPGEDRAH